MEKKSERRFAPNLPRSFRTSQTFLKLNFVSQRRRASPPIENQKNLDLKRGLTNWMGISIIFMSIAFSESTLTFPNSIF